ncbi:MAG: YolD-like family protein [Firmicutes bacterium]|nr:YolD-like family protein [Bacillota bacterium]
MKKRRGKMPVSERAKQFAPFAAINGLDAALARKEREHARKARIEIMEDEAVGINAKLSELYVGEFTEITYYCRGHYVTAEGEIQLIDPRRKLLVLDGKEIHFKDLYSIK